MDVAYLMFENLLFGDFVNVLKTWLFGPTSLFYSDPNNAPGWKLASERVYAIKNLSLFIFLGRGEISSAF